MRVEPRDGGLLIGEAKEFFNTMVQPGVAHYWDVSPDGQQLLTMEAMTSGGMPNIEVVVNWLEASGHS